MLNIKYIRENTELIKKNSADRLSKVDIDKLLEIDKKRRELEEEITALRSKRNAASKSKPTDEEIQEMKSVGDEIQKLEKELEPLQQNYKELILEVPNLTHPDVKVSQDEDDNEVLEQNMEPTRFDFIPLDHVELAEKLDLIDFNRGTKVTGAKFYYLKNEVALLELALTQYAFKIATSHGFTPIITPDLAKREILTNMGYCPRGESTQIYNIENSDLSLIGTAEITMGGYHSDETLKEEDLPKKYVALSHCFRTEAGSYSKFSKGIFRVHQFTKVEMFEFTTPENSEKAHIEILEIEKEIFKGLEIPFRVIDHSTADLGTPSYRTYDLEAWMPGKPNKDGSMGDWAEITSTSNCTDYQSRALNIKFQSKTGEKEFVHMINGTAIAMTRPIIAILENFQQKDGSIKMPEVLIPYLGFSEIKPK
ncbi:MAG: serine--tRNA ligase [Patescibacteria group bacterium]